MIKNNNEIFLFFQSVKGFDSKPKQLIIGCWFLFQPSSLRIKVSGYASCRWTSVGNHVMGINRSIIFVNNHNKINPLSKVKQKENKLTTISPKLDGSPVSWSTTKLMPSGGDFIRSRTSLATLARVRGGKFSIELTLPVLLDRLYERYNEPRATLLLLKEDEDIFFAFDEYICFMLSM